MKIIQFIKNNYLLLAILLLGAVLRFYKLDFQSVWLDEIHTLNEANPNIPISQLNNVIKQGEQMPQLYFYLMYFIFKIFGYTTFVLRSFSATLGILGVFFVYLLGKEIYNRRVGLFVSFFVCINPFHIYYSQDGRPYVLLFLTTILSFYFLIKFIKTVSKKNSIYFGIFSSLMILSHFFGLFALLSQIIILTIFLFFKKENRKSFFINILISGIVIFLFFLPAIPLFIQAASIKQFWIEPPAQDVFTKIYNSFFGTSEILLSIINFLAFLFFLRVSRIKKEVNSYESIIKNPTILSFIILVVWILLVILVPLIRSYVVIPMIVDRYFINILPAVLIIVAIGFDYIKNKVVTVSVILIVLVLSVTDLVFIKKYYKTVNKTQFREITQFITENNKNNEPIVTSLGWYFPFFLDNDKNHFTIVDKKLEFYVEEMINYPDKIKPFWYVDGHMRPYSLTQKCQKFMDDKFEIEDNLDLYDTWTKHYVLKGQNSFLNIPLKTSDFSKNKGEKISFSVDVFNIDSGYLTTFGWASIENQDSKNSKIELFLLSSDKIFRLESQSALRKDVTNAFNNKFNLDNCGYSSKKHIDDLPKGRYQLGIKVIDRKSKKEGFVLTNRFIEL